MNSDYERYDFWFRETVQVKNDELVDINLEDIVLEDII